MRPSFHCAMAWPFSAAYSSEFTAFTVSPALSQFAPERNASTGVIGGGPTLASVLLPSSACAGAAANKPPITRTQNILLGVRITLFLGSAARMCDRATNGGAHLLGVFPQVTGSKFAFARLPCALAPGELLDRKFDIERALHRVDLNDVAIADEADRAADRRFRTDMTDTEPTGSAGETPVGDQRNFLPRPLAVKRGRGREHLAHARATTRPLIADHQHIAVFVLAFLHRIEAGLFAVETAGRTAEFQRLHAGHLH